MNETPTGADSVECLGRDHIAVELRTLNELTLKVTVDGVER